MARALRPPCRWAPFVVVGEGAAARKWLGRVLSGWPRVSVCCDVDILKLELRHRLCDLHHIALISFELPCKRRKGGCHVGAITFRGGLYCRSYDCSRPNPGSN